jgi:hypothetical protein
MVVLLTCHLIYQYGLNILCLPDAHVAKLVEKQIAQQWEKRLEDEEE